MEHAHTWTPTHKHMAEMQCITYVTYLWILIISIHTSRCGIGWSRFGSHCFFFFWGGGVPTNGKYFMLRFCPLNPVPSTTSGQWQILESAVSATADRASLKILFAGPPPNKSGPHLKSYASKYVEGPQWQRIFFSSFLLFTFWNHWNLFWVNQNGNLMPLKGPHHISCWQSPFA